jgi:hypothetical protein
VLAEALHSIVDQEPVRAGAERLGAAGGHRRAVGDLEAAVVQPVAGIAIARLNSGKEGSTATTSIRMTARQSLFQARRCSTLPNQFDRTQQTAFEIAPAVAAPARSP